MYVKVIRPKRDGEFERTSCYECQRYDFFSGVDEELFLILDNDSMNEVNLEIDKTDGTEVYIENNEGKTIDFYRWN